MTTTGEKTFDSLYFIWTIALKDIVDALRNKLILSLILGMSFMLLMPKVLGLMLVPSETPVLVYDPGESQLAALLDNSDQYEVQRVGSMKELEQTIGSTGFGLGVEYGVAVPGDFDQILDAGGQPEIEGYVAWANRAKATEFRIALEREIERVAGYTPHINSDSNIVYPPTDSGLWLILVAVTPVTVILMMGISLVPALLFEEKQTKTMEALLVTPSSISQVVVGKALAGLFYVAVAAGVVFAINWTGVVHWDVVLLFVLGVGAFSVAVGLILGSFFERQQDVAGLTMLLLVILIGALFVDMLNLDVPAAVHAILPWVPSVALSEIIRFVFLENTPWIEIWRSFAGVAVISALLYAVVIWRVRQSDR